jgi:flagellar protein FliO/FliZ
MTWMIIRLILSLGFIAVVLLYAARLAKKKGLGQGNGVIEVVSRQRLGRTSSVNVIRIADVVLVVGATEEQVTAERRVPTPRAATGAAVTGGVAPALVARNSTGALAGSVFDRAGWGTFVHALRERTVRKS